MADSFCIPHFKGDILLWHIAQVAESPLKLSDETGRERLR